MFYAHRIFMHVLRRLDRVDVHVLCDPTDDSLEPMSFPDDDGKIQVELRKACALGGERPDPRRVLFQDWFRCAECGGLSRLANGQSLFIGAVSRGNIAEGIRLLKSKLAEARAVREEHKAKQENNAVLAANDEIRGMVAKMAALYRNLEDVVVECSHCGWAPGDENESD